MNRAISRAFTEAAGPGSKICSGCRGPVPWVEELRSMVLAPNGVWMELSTRFDAATRQMVDMTYCTECGQSVGPKGVGVAHLATAGLTGSIIRVWRYSEAGGGSESAEELQGWGLFLGSWLTNHGREDLTSKLGQPWVPPSGPDGVWMPSEEDTREMDMGAGDRKRVLRVAKLETPEVTQAIVTWADAYQREDQGWGARVS